MCQTGKYDEIRPEIQSPRNTKHSKSNFIHRYAVIAFGGEAPFDNAHSIVHNNEIFTDSSRIKHHFNHIKTGNGNSSDISRAIKLAAELVYRPGASKTLILMPCSPCNASGMHVSCIVNAFTSTYFD